ncbi:SDR family oxidoreductase [Nocardia vinacea]|uniref:SDR family oxidoreductase n=1 Tax=Nocardia vinacea TaxID=96468 RepID=A0ABZ1YVV1_9NOCA|nr:SDR family oxidoreductase [Nocardia vinacea]
MSSSTHNTDASSDPVVLVTGSSTGIGAEIARRFGAAGYRVAVNSANSVDEGEKVASDIPGAIYFRADISDDTEAKDLVNRVVAEFGGLDILVNNAGVTRQIPHEDLTAASVEVWREIFEVNVFGTWRLSVAAVEHLGRSPHGQIINISSIAASRPAGSSIPYAVSKAAVEHLTRLLAATLGPRIRVNAVAPGLIDTEFTVGLTGPREQVRNIAPLRRIGNPVDVAAAVLGIAGSEYSTGTVLLVDGGVHLR